MNPGLEASPAPADPAQAPSDAPVLASDRRNSSRSNRDPRALLDEVIAELQQRPGAPDVTLVDRAFELATRAHEGQRRRSGEPYLIHPVRVARTIARMGLGACSVAAGLLHDSVEDSELTVPDVAEHVGNEVAIIVDGVTKMGKVPYLSRQEQQAESFRKMLLAMSQDIRVLLVKLADRLDNMQTLEHMPQEKRARISRETMEIYAPLAHQLGVQAIRSELENLSFRYLEPAEYENVTSKVDGLLEASPRFIDDGVEELTRAFAESEQGRGALPDDDVRWERARFGDVQVKPRVRTTYEVYRALEARANAIEHPSDVVQYELIVRDRTACYIALGVVHSLFKPVPGAFRDHVALPRPNHYQALHTTVVNRSGVRRRIHIRSGAMDAVASRGIVAEWERDSEPAAGDMNPGGRWRRPLWLKEVMDWQEEVSDPHEFIAAVKADLFADEVYVFTPQGDIRTLPKGATPIDFAFAIHTDVGSRCSGARVNGQLVPLRYQLRQGDTVEIITSPNARPRREWLKLCRSARARTRIKQHLRHEERTRLRSIGRSLLEQALGLRGQALGELEERGVVAEKAETFHLGRDLKGIDGLYEAAGAGLLTVEKIIDVLAPPRPEPAEARATRSETNLFTRMIRSLSGRKGEREPSAEETAKGARGLGAAAREGAPETPIQVTRAAVDSIGSGGAMIQLATCCQPIPGDPLIGHFVPNKGIIAHVESCPDALDPIGERRVYLAWEPGLELARSVTVEVRTTNTVGLLAEMSRVFSHHGVNIKQANCRTYDSGQRAINTFHATVSALDQLESLMQALQEIDGVLAVRRVFGRSSYQYERS